MCSVYFQKINPVLPRISHSSDFSPFLIQANGLKIVARVPQVQFNAREVGVDMSEKIWVRIVASRLRPLGVQQWLHPNKLVLAERYYYVECLQQFK
ncbi:hypothetical protein PM082_021665 [Marasmius tenuissimus]|nr:hypothetical protein PM082_021665 [Marasmius tenuissimus]